jgi:transcriptional regulator with XRE-family HTH domain
MALSSRGNGGTLWLTRAYNFIDKDPECDRFRTLYQKQRIKESDLAVLAGLSVTTVKNMFGGQTRRPQHSTLAKMAGAMGHEYGLQLVKTPDYEKEIPIAREQFKAHKAALKKKREAEERRPRRKKA